MDNEQEVYVNGIVGHWNQICDSVPLAQISDIDKDMIWCVTRLRLGAYLTFANMGLMDPNLPLGAWETVEPIVKSMLMNYFVLAAQHPAKIEYSAEKIETPRLDILSGTLSVYEQLKSDDNYLDSARELMRIIAVNEDSDHERIGYATLMGIILKIVEWNYPDVDLKQMIDNLFVIPQSEQESAPNVETEVVE